MKRELVVESLEEVGKPSVDTCMQRDVRAPIVDVAPWAAEFGIERVGV